MNDISLSQNQILLASAGVGFLTYYLIPSENTLIKILPGIGTGFLTSNYLTKNLSGLHSFQDSGSIIPSLDLGSSSGNNNQYLDPNRYVSPNNGYIDPRGSSSGFSGNPFGTNNRFRLL